MTPSQETSVPYGFCHCGCGRKTSIRTYTIRSKGMFKGEPARYIQGHPRRPYPNDGPLFVAEDRGYKTPCWIWQRGKDKDGYAISRSGKGTRKVHRQRYEQKFGPIPEGLQPDHLCRQKACINPDHMEAVTPAENTRRRKNATLTMQMAAEIRSLAGGMMQKDIAALYQIPAGRVSEVIRGKTWRP